MNTIRCSSKARAWWKADVYTEPDTTNSPLLNLPGELRNMIYDMVFADTQRLLIRDGKIVDHALAQVNQQIRSEFRPILFPQNSLAMGEKYPTPVNIALQLCDFDFLSTMEVLDRCAVTPSTNFHIQVKVTKQLHRDEWKKLWPWVQFCDRLMPKESYQGKTLSTSYAVDLELHRCNPYAASHELYVETMPYILRGAGGPHGMFSGYEEIGKIRAALRDAVVKG
ncbi:hypothetical protein Slin14017_G017360 [Septoria linicola]|nr:hypothetical protein Slin14017_G017360 [Septoria linicola]